MVSTQLFRTPLSDQAAVDHEAQAWATMWDEGAVYTDAFKGESCKAPPLQVQGIRQAAKSFPVGTGLGGDNIAPRAIGRLSDNVLLLLIRLFSIAEILGSWPMVCQLVLIVLLPKPDGGRRPIGLFPTVVRIWFRARIEIAKLWDSAINIDAFYGSSGRGAAAGGERLQ